MKKFLSTIPWRVWGAGGLAFLTAGYVALGWRGPVPADGAAHVYWLTVFFNSTAWSAVMMCGLSFFTLLTLWILALVQRAPTRLALGLLTASLLLMSGAMGWVGAPVLVDNYHHIGTAELNGHTYHLGVRFQLEDSAYLVSDCPPATGWCEVHDLTEAGHPNFDELPQLLADPGAGTLTIRVGETVVYSYKPER